MWTLWQSPLLLLFLSCCCRSSSWWTIPGKCTPSSRKTCQRATASSTSSAVRSQTWSPCGLPLMSGWVSQGCTKDRSKKQMQCFCFYQNLYTIFTYLFISCAEVKKKQQCVDKLSVTFKMQHKNDRFACLSLVQQTVFSVPVLKQKGCPSSVCVQFADKTIGEILRTDEKYNRFLSLVDVSI